MHYWSVVGDSCGYLIGKRLGPRIFQKDDSLFFKGEYVERARLFFERYGMMTLMIARFTPVVRTFAPTMAGVARMNYRTFFTYNVLGGTAWSLVLIFLGYFLGKTIPNIDHYLLPIVAAIIILSLIGPAKHIIDHRIKRG
jgi:membrane-associated protein